MLESLVKEEKDVLTMRRYPIYLLTLNMTIDKVQGGRTYRGYPASKHNLTAVLLANNII